MVGDTVHILQHCWSHSRSGLRLDRHLPSCCKRSVVIMHDQTLIPAPDCWISSSWFYIYHRACRLSCVPTRRCQRSSGSRIHTSLDGHGEQGTSFRQMTLVDLWTLDRSFGYSTLGPLHRLRTADISNPSPSTKSNNEDRPAIRELCRQTTFTKRIDQKHPWLLLHKRHRCIPHLN